MFNRKKKQYEEDYEEYYDEYEDEYEDEYDDEMDDDDDEYEEVKESVKRNRPEMSKKDRSEKNSKEYLHDSSEQINRENQRLQKEVQRQKTMTERLKTEVENKQQEIDQLTIRLTSSSKAKERIQTLESQLMQAEEKIISTSNKNIEYEKELAFSDKTKEQTRLLKNQLEKVEHELSEILLTNEKLKQDLAKQDAMKNQIAEVLMEAKSKGQQIQDRANMEADRTVETAKHQVKKVVADAADELKFINKEAANYHNRLARLQTESSLLMEELLEKSSKLADQTIN